MGKMNPKGVSAEKILYAARFGAKIQYYFDNPPFRSRYLKGLYWTPATFSDATGLSETAIGNWLRGESLPTKSMATIVRELFGDEPDQYKEEISELWSIFRYCKQLKDTKHPFPAKIIEASSSRVYSDPSGHVANLNYPDIDGLIVEEKWHFTAIRYGEGVQCVEVPGSRLLWLDPSEKLADGQGVRRSLTAYFPPQEKDLLELSNRWDLFFPRRIQIIGPKMENATVRIFACTDIPYEQGSDNRNDMNFDAEAILGVGGIAAFVDRHGAFRPHCTTEMGGGLGCVIALVAIAYVDRHPVYRSPYCLMIRKGVRYPDDVWISPATSQPVFSSAEPAQGRFLFQSRESKGGSTDMFAANFNGTMMVNLNEADETAWDGFVDAEGNDLVTWSGNRITFGSCVTGKGFPEKITREDRP